MTRRGGKTGGPPRRPGRAGGKCRAIPCHSVRSPGPPARVRSAKRRDRESRCGGRRTCSSSVRVRTGRTAWGTWSLTQLIGCNIIATDQLLHAGSSADRGPPRGTSPRKGVIMAQTPSTSTEREGLALSDNIEIITRFEHAFRAADQATIDELCDPGLVNHNPAPDETPTLVGFKQMHAGYKASFPDLEEDLQDIIASGDTVATRWVVTGSQQQELMGIPASGQTIRVEGMNFYRLNDGLVTYIWTQFASVARS